MEGIIAFLQEYLFMPALIAMGNNIFVENIKDGIKSAYPECRLRTWFILLFVFILGVALYGIYAIMKGADPICAIYTPALSLAFYQFKPYRRMLNYAKVRANEKGATLEDKDV